MDMFAPEHEFDAWFTRAVGAPTPIQQRAWPVVRQGGHALIVAATGQGKSLAAWRPLVERMVEDIPERRAGQPDTRPATRGVRALHIAPLKALARDMTHNLAPLLRFAGERRGRPLQIALRCGDTPPAERTRQKRRPPEILSTTPESLFVLLGSRGGRALLGGVQAVVVDEIHALAACKRGAHLALSLARLDRLCGRPIQRIGLSATAAPGRALAEFLAGDAECTVVDAAADGRGGQRMADRPAVDLPVVNLPAADQPAIELELPEAPLGAYAGTLHWQQIHERIADLAGGLPDQCPSFRNDGSMLVFCQTRAQVERSSAALGELIGADRVGAHHGSLDTAHREAIEARFRAGEIKVLVSSASLELGLDLGVVDRVCQLGVPGSANLLRQRAGRSGHRPGGRPRIHLFALTLNQLVEAEALKSLLHAGVVERTPVPRGALDVAAQHVAAMVAAEGPLSSGEILATLRCARPYRGLSEATLERLAAALLEAPEGIPEAQRARLLERTADGRLAPAPDADRLVLANAGVIPEFFEYDVTRVDTGERVGRLDEEFAFESSPGQVLQLGHRAWRILSVRTGEVRVEPTDEPPGNLPFWFGEGPGRTPEAAAAMLRAIETRAVPPQALAMLDESRAVLGALPGRNRLVVERFRDPGGDRHVVLHTFAGARINRAWGLALRKRFCRRFNFELQAAATDDGILISLGITSEFEVGDVTGFVRSHQAGDVLTQALLDTPLFVTRFRWCANNALLLPRRRFDGPRSGSIPAQQKRSAAENLIACVFPDQLACLENLSGPREIPDHPLVHQALHDCLNEYMDLPGLVALLERIERGRLRVHAVDHERPSPLAEALIHAPIYSFLDEAAAEERRTRAFEGTTGPARRRGTGRPAPVPGRDCPAKLRSVAGAEPGSGRGALRASADALEKLLVESGFLTAAEGERGAGLAPPVPAAGWSRCFAQLVRERRALTVTAPGTGTRLWVAAERVGWLLELNPELDFGPWLSPSLIGEPPGGTAGAYAWVVDGRRRFDGDDAGRRVAALLGVGARASAG
ncbi:MAG: DEAD/DEAH box helicase [Wenzhouxiangellaceae bacterium]|nr:DEAD/DEAH box helicase [Wenzhouxiangellaceae bacterium]